MHVNMLVSSNIHGMIASLRLKPIYSLLFALLPDLTRIAKWYLVQANTSLKANRALDRRKSVQIALCEKLH